MSALAGMRTLLILGRVSNLPTVWTNVAAGWFLCGGGWTPELGWIALSMSLLYVAGMTLNDAFDAEWDRQHAPERPIPAGRISERATWALGIGQGLAGAAVLSFLSTAHPLFLGLLIVTIVAYDWLHKRWQGSVALMGLCRAFVYLGAGSAVVVHTTDIEVSGVVWLVAAGIALYIAGITLAARSEHRESPAGPGFGARLLLMLPILFPLIASRGAPESPETMSFVVVGVIGAWAWLVIVRAALRDHVPRGVSFGLAGIAFFDATVLAFADWRAAVGALGCFVLALAFQRLVPAT